MFRVHPLDVRVIGPGPTRVTVSQFRPFPRDLRIVSAAGSATICTMRSWTEPRLPTLVRLYLQYEHSFVAHRHVQRFGRGEISVQEAVAQIREGEVGAAASEEVVEVALREQGVRSEGAPSEVEFGDPGAWGRPCRSR